MRDPAPLIPDLIINDHILTKIQFLKILIGLTQYLCRQGLSPLRHLIDQHFKFCKHGLPVHCSLKLLQEMIDQYSTLLLVRGLSQQILH